MTVAELIAKLSGLPPDLPVFVSIGCHVGELSPAKDVAAGSYVRDRRGDHEHPVAWGGEPAGGCVVVYPEEYR